ncbi:DNA replication/repair protein RecF [Anaerotardibacter muris]|uniref:DNA replication/repair protein RecF n=1 Tax=Anaerotardibacter muris TaxID=2941505 RepID=UPI00203C209F|nr:DNA replication and repair protein RecF [Anaerotardibacter muris]
MGLKIQQIHYYNFRNYSDYKLEDLGDLTLFIGPNAIGKTNLIEGIQLITAFTSFRSTKSDHLVKFGEQSAFVKALLRDDKRKLDMHFTLQEGKRAFLLNGKRKQIKSLRGILPSVVFSPDDLTFIKGSQSGKRAQIDNLGEQISVNYHTVRRDYERILRQKNKYLKESTSHGFLESVNEVLTTIGSQFFVLRAQLVQELIPYIQRFYSDLSAGREEVTINYIPSWDKYLSPDLIPNDFPQFSRSEAKEKLDAIIEQEFNREHQRGLALFGPHADQIIFMIDGKDASHFASQGQQRSLVLSFKMAEVALLKDKLDQTPVLLLDDVMSELDEVRRKQLIQVISQDMQTFITSTNLSYFDDDFLNKADIIHLDHDIHTEGSSEEGIRDE